jgi:hypothetical protein
VDEACERCSAAGGGGFACGTPMGVVLSEQSGCLPFHTNKLKAPLDLEVKAVLEVLTTSSSSLQSSRRWRR